MIELIPDEAVKASFSTPFAIEGAKTYGWRLSVRSQAPIPWVPDSPASSQASCAFIHFCDGSKLIIATRTSKPLNQTTHLHFEARQLESEAQAKNNVDRFRRKLILLDAINHLGLEVSASDDGSNESLEGSTSPKAPSYIDQLNGGAADAFIFPENVGVKGICSDIGFDEPKIETSSLHAALDALVRHSIDVQDAFSGAVDLLRSAGRERSLRARFLLTFGAFEALCTIEDRPEADRQLLTRIDALVQDANIPAERKSSLRSAIGNLRRQPLRDAMLARVRAASLRSGVDRESAAVLIKRAKEVRDRVAHPSHPKLPSDVAEVSNQLHLLVVRLILSESNSREYEVPTVKWHYDYGSMKGAIIFPLNAAKIWYSH